MDWHKLSKLEKLLWWVDERENIRTPDNRFCIIDRHIADGFTAPSKWQYFDMSHIQYRQLAKEIVTWQKSMRRR